MKMAGEIYVSRELIDKLGIPDLERIKVRAGVKAVPAQLVIRDEQPRDFILSSQLARELQVTKWKKLQIRYDFDKKLIHIGPIIGILTDYIPHRVEYDPKSLQAELIYLSKLGHKLPGFIYIFTPNSINWTNKTVKGYVYRGIEHGMWSASVYPLPDVVYDRIASRRGEMRPRTRQAKKRLKDLPYLQYFNPSFLNKWRVHRMLIQNKDLIPYLPETSFLNLQNLTEMIHRYKILYLKPCNGSLGSGIIKVVRTDNGHLRYTIYKHGRRSGVAKSPHALMKATRGCRGNKSYIVQQGLNLATYGKSPFDIRIIYQKNSDGLWMLSKKFVRVAPRGSSIANLSRGGNAETSKQVFNKILRNQELIDSKNEEMRNICQTVAETLESVSQKTFGELGLDIGLDRDRNLWLIEVNSKPRKTTETNLSQGIVRNTFQRPLKYAVYLAGFRNRR